MLRKSLIICLNQHKKFVSVNMPEPLLVAWKKKALKEMQEIINLP